MIKKIDDITGEIAAPTDYNPNGYIPLREPSSRSLVRL